jgi:hypothetical protein
MKLIKTLVNEGISHIEDLSIDEFISAVETLKNKQVTEKLDGANLWFGVDENGFFTSREGKSKTAKRFYSVNDYPLVANYNGFRGAHEALSRHQDSIKRHLSDGDMVEVEVLFGRQPNTVTYGDEKNYIVILRGIETDQAKIEKLSSSLNGKHSKVSSVVITSDDGETLKQENVEQVWTFAKVKPVDVSSVDISPAHQKIEELKKYLKQPNSKVPGMTNKEVAEVNLGKIDKDQRPEVKAEREAQLEFIAANFKNPIKEFLLSSLVRKVKPFLQSKDIQPDEDIGVEGVVATDNNGNMIKIVDKDVFTAINSFNNQIRSAIAGLVRTDDQDAPIELRGGAFGQAKIRIAELLGVRDLALSSSSKKILAKFQGANAEETANNIASSLNIVSFNATREKVSAILENSIKEIDEILDSFKSNVDSYRLKIEKTGKEIGISPEVMKRTLTAFAETKRDINEINKAVLKSRQLPELVMALYGRTIQGLFTGSKTDVKESFKLIKMFEDGDGGGDAAPAAPPTEANLATNAGSIAPLQKRLFNGKLITRRPRKFIKKKKFAKKKVHESLIKMAEQEVVQNFAKGVDDSASAKSDVEFKSLRNNIAVSGDQVTSQDVTNYLNKAHELNDEVDTVTFGLEMDDGSVAKVYVNHSQADEFEKALSTMLGQEDDLEKVIDELSNSFDIVDIEWPNDMVDDGTPIAVADPEAEEQQQQDVEGGQITSTIDGEGEHQIEPVINLSGDDVADDSGEEDSGEFMSLLKQADGDLSDKEEDNNEESSDGEESSDFHAMFNDGEETPADEKDQEESAADTPDVEADEKGMDLPDLGDLEDTEEEPTDEPSEDDEATDEESTEEDDEDEESTDEMPKGKKKKKSAASETDTTDTKESNTMSFGQKFKEKLLAEQALLEKKKAAPKAEDKQKAVEDLHAFPADLKKLMTEFPNRGSKMMLGLMHTLGVPLDAMIMKKSELKESVNGAGDLYMKDNQVRLWTKRVMDGLMEASAPLQVAEGLEKELSNVNEKLVLALLKKIGMVESIEKIARGALRKGVKKTASIIQADSKLRMSIKVLGEHFGVDGVTGDMKGPVKEAKNHMGETEYSTFKSWKEACKKANAAVWFEGDADIAQAMVGPKPYKRGETVAIGEWDGDKGVLFKKVNEEAGEPPLSSIEGYVEMVKSAAMALGIPPHAFEYKAAQTHIAMKQSATKVKNRTMVLRRLQVIMDILNGK